MKNVVLSLVAIFIAGIAAIAATTAMLNTPVKPAHIGTPKSDKPADPNAPPPSSTPPSIPAPTPGPAPAPTDNQPAPGTDDGAVGAPKSAEPAEPQADKDPYEGIAPEEFPPDLQYDADASVSFPTNT
jgi:hypothetical protein